jgi:hypothetical protein
MSMEDPRMHDRVHASTPVRPSRLAAAIAAQLRGNRPRFTAPAALALLLAGTSTAQAAVYTVTHNGHSGPGSLRQALASANAHPGMDEILIDPAVGGTIDLRGQALRVEESLRLTGPGAENLAIDGDGAAAVFTLHAPSTDTEIALSLSGIRLTNAAHGILASSEPDAQGSMRIAVADTRITGTTDAAISLSATNPDRQRTRADEAKTRLSVLRSIISGNQGDGIRCSDQRLPIYYSTFVTEVLVEQSTIAANTEEGIDADQCRVELADSEVTGNATGVAAIGRVGERYYSTPALHLHDSLIAGNRGPGVIGDSAHAKLTRTSVLRNGGAGVRLTDDMGTIEACAVVGNGAGGVVLDGLTASRLVSSTISGNSGGFGIDAASLVYQTRTPPVYVGTTTVTDNEDGGIRVGGYYAQIRVRDSVIAGNGSAHPLDLARVEDQEFGFSIAYSLVQAPGPGFEWIYNNGPGSNVIGVDPMLSPLTNNGGPTLTRAPRQDSPVVDAGNPAWLPDPEEFDQRGDGFVRVHGGRADMGAVERQPVTRPVGSVRAGHRWTALCRSDLNRDPVIFLGPPGYVGTNPGVVRMRERTVEGCPADVRFQEWDYRARDLGDRAHTAERIGLLGLAPGRYHMPDGSVWEVGRQVIGGTGRWTRYRFEDRLPEPLPGKPSLFLTLQSTNGPQAVVMRARGVDAGGFQAALFEEEALMEGHVPELFGYLAIYHPDSADGNVGAGEAAIGGSTIGYALSRASIDHRWTEIGGVHLKLEEERSMDDETVHVPETVDVLVIDGQVLAQQVTANGWDTAALRRK